jgi:hypothetical protein
MSFDELYDNMLHDEFRGTPEGDSGAHGLQGVRHSLASSSRSRTVALVASGGLACAVVGALLGGLGGEFGVSPASAHSLSSSSDFVPLTQLANAAFSVPQVIAPAVVKPKGGSLSSVGGNTVTSLPTTLGGVVKGITAADPATPVLDASQSPTGISTVADTTSKNGGADVGTKSTSANPLDAVTGVLTDGLSGVLTDLTASLRGIMALPSNPSAGLTGAVGPLVNVLSDLSSTLSNLIAILPAPTTLGTPGLPVVLAGAPVVSNGSAITSGAAAPSVSGLPKTVTSTITPLLGSLTAPITGVVAPDPSFGSGLPSLPTVPLPVFGSTPLPSLPVISTVVSSLPTLPTVDLPILPTASTGTPTCVSTPPVSLPLPTGISGVITLGPVSLGVNIGSSSSATVCATS